VFLWDVAFLKGLRGKVEERGVYSEMEGVDGRVCGEEVKEGSRFRGCARISLGLTFRIFFPPSSSSLFSYFVFIGACLVCPVL
jgi:hypothetical protein